MRGLHLIAVGKACDNRFLGRLDVGDVGTGGEEVACSAKVKNGPFVDDVHVYVDCVEERGGGKGGRASRQYSLC